MTDTPETDNLARGNHVVPTEFAQQLERERDKAMDALSEISLYLSVGMGDKFTTAKQYYERILEGIGMLTRPIMQMLEESREQRDRLTEALQEMQYDRTDKAIKMANEALQFLTSNQND